MSKTIGSAPQVGWPHPADLTPTRRRTAADGEGLRQPPNPIAATITVGARYQRSAGRNSATATGAAHLASILAKPEHVRMVDRANVYLEKAEESVAGAYSELANGRYNNCANRAFSACFQAAIHALMAVGIRPPRAAEQWGHGFVQARFSGDLINRRKLYAADLRGALEQAFRLRAKADYGMDHVPEVQAARAVRRAEAFVAAAAQVGGRRNEG